MECACLAICSLKPLFLGDSVHILSGHQLQVSCEQHSLQSQACASGPHAQKLEAALGASQVLGLAAETLCSQKVQICS